MNLGRTGVRAGREMGKALQFPSVSRLTSWASLAPSCWGPSDKTCGKVGNTEHGISTVLATEIAWQDLSPFVYTVIAPSVSWPASAARSSRQYAVLQRCLQRPCWQGS